jgi:uncharacterized protein with HEPN domain
MRSEIGDKVRLYHMLDSIQQIEEYVVNADYDTFVTNSMMRFACIKQLEIIGEASNHISEEIKLKFTTVQWNQIRGMRNVFVHEYFGIDSALVWDILKNELPDLKIKVNSILAAIS